MSQTMLSPGRLLDSSGNLMEAGYATSLVKEYQRKDIVNSRFRIKEWDYYYIGNQDFGLALTIADNSYMGMGSISFLDFRCKEWKTKSTITWFPMGKTKFPSTSVIGDVHFHSKAMNISFFNDGTIRKMVATCKDFQKKEDVAVEVYLTETPKDSMVIATPFSKPRHFYYNQKINCLKAMGILKLGSKTYEFENSYAVLDWGRGVWPYQNCWYWSSLSGKIGENTIGFNFGYGFGDTSKASENMIFLNGIATKVNRVEFLIPKDKQGKELYLQPWRIVSDDQKVNLVFEPILDRNDDTDFVVLKSLQHQVFGKFSGTLGFDSGTLEISDLIGFGEKVYNKW